MPRKTKEQIEENTPEKEVKKSKLTTKKAPVAKKEVKSKSTASKKSTTVKAKKDTATNKKATTKKASTSVKKSVSNKSTAKKSTTTAKNTTTKRTTTTKKSTTKKSTAQSKKPAKVTAIPVVEYYDLPYRYNQTVVKLLAQTPTNLFVYWDISDEDRENYIKTYGERFFEETKPVLIIHNNTMNYSYEVEINDFANCWYIHVNDSKCDYSIELGRRPIPSVSHISVEYIYMSSSNQIESPNDKILFNVDAKQVYFRNVKTNVTSTKSFSFIKNMGKIYNIYDLYKAVYKDEVLEDLTSSTFR